MLRAARAELVELFYPDVVGNRFRTEQREPDADIGDLVAGVSIVVCAGWLHHMYEPRTLLARLVQAPAALVVLDTTVEMMVEIIAAERNSPFRGVCEEHFICRDAARAVGFDLEEDIDALWREVSTPPTFFQYRITCCWCGGSSCCHRGHEYWFAVWNKMSL